MKKPTRKTNKNQDRKAQRAKKAQENRARVQAAILRREQEVKKLNQMLSEALTKKKQEADEAGAEFDPSEEIGKILQAAGVKNPHLTEKSATS